MTFFETIAVPLARDRGWKIAPCYPKKKEVHTKLVPQPLRQMSNSLAQIRAWGEKEPEANVCVYAQQIEGGLCFLDKDGAEDIREAYKRETGKDFQTLFVRSSIQNGVEKGHWYFLQTARTRNLAKNISEDVTGGWFSFRVKNEYVCSIGSIHPVTGEPYKVIDDCPIVPMPDELLDWLQAQVVRKASRPGRRGGTAPRGKLTKGMRYPALISEVGRLWDRGWERELTIKTGIEWAKENFDVPGGAFDEVMVRGEIEHLIDSYPQGTRAANDDAGPYRIQDGCICFEKDTQHGPIRKPLCNFVAHVEEEIVLDDGAETTRAFVLRGSLASGRPLPSGRVPAAKFGGMTWVADQWGLGAIVNAGLSTRDQLREAIQRLSPNPHQRRVYTHSGWRKIDGAWVFLTASGAVGSEGFEVDLGTELAKYSLPRTPQNPREAMRASLRLLDIAPLTVTAPLWAAMFRAPLASACPLDSSLWLEGLTGSLKSTLAALFLSHFGSFSDTSLPGSWSSTANQLERRAFILKDVPFVIDDYAPSGFDSRELEVKAGRLLRSQGNLSGRSRLRADLTERPGFPPRGIIIGTGEQHPPGHSVLARTMLLELDRSTVNMAALSEAQRTSSSLLKNPFPSQL